MPVYLVHGFRWPREGFTGIRVHAVVHNLDDCSVEYIQNENSRADILASFHKAFPEIMKELDGPVGGRRLEFIEQYNPDDMDGPYAVSQPYAFVGDKVVMIAAGPGTGTGPGGGASGPGVAQGISSPPPSGVGQPPAPAPAAAAGGQQQPPLPPESPKTPQKKTRAATQPMSKSAPFNSPADTAALSINMEEVIADGPGLTNKAWEALADLRDKIAEGEKIGWWVVYNGDPERSFDDVEDDENDDDEMADEEMVDVPEAADETVADRRLDSPTAYLLQHPPLASNQGLTALPVRQAQAAPSTTTTAARPDKGKQREVPPEPAKLKESAKSQGLRKKFFGRRS